MTDAKHEAPAEGAGEWEAIARAIDADALLEDSDGCIADPTRREKAMAAAKRVLALRARSSAPEAREEALGNLLAVIHSDGGHRALEVGTKQAALEAEKIVAGLLAAPDPEAPAEGAGEALAAAERVVAAAFFYEDNELFEDSQTVLKALRARSSAPEAHDGDQPFSYAYRYPDPMGGTVVRLDTNGREINGSKPIEAIALYTHPAAPSADKLRDDK